MDRAYNVLFLCTGNSARSVIAEALMTDLGRGRFHGYSAGSFPKGEVNPHVEPVLRALGRQLSEFRSKSWDEFADPAAPQMDFVITVCDAAAGEVCPIWPGHPATAHWGIPDPAAATGNPAEIGVAFAEAARQLRNRIDLFLQLPIESLDRMALQARLTAIGAHADSIAEARGASSRDASLEPPLERFSAGRRLVAEALGTGLLVAIVIGSGIMGERLAGGNAAIALLGNTLATGAGLVVLISIFGPVSGAHFNPAVTLVFALRRELPARLAAAYVVAQVAGGVLGTFLAHAMFAEPILQLSAKARDGPAQGLSELVATFGLVGTILGVLRFRPAFTPAAVGLYITAAYWFTASTSFANPAVTVARSLSDTFAGIAPGSVPLFIGAQLAGAALAAVTFKWLLTSGPGD